MLAEIRDAKDAKKIMDMATAAEVYARKASLGKEAEDYARTIKIDAQTILGEFVNETISAAGGRPKKPAHNGQVSKSLKINKHVRQQARCLAIAKKKNPKLHASVRNGETSVRKLRGLLLTPAELKEEGRKKRITIMTREYEHLLEMALALNSFEEFDADKGKYRDDSKRRLTPERMRDAGSNLLRIAQLWSQHENNRQETTVAK